MLAKVHAAAIVGLEGAIVEVEVDTSRGLPSFTIVGLPDTAVQESRERVQAAVKNAGLQFPRQRVTVNLAPANLRKEGPAYDLPIALGALAASHQMNPAWLEGCMAVGELSLDGSLRHIRGVLPMASLTKNAGLKRILLPRQDAAEAALIPGLEVIPVESLTQLLNHLSGVIPIPPQAPAAPEVHPDLYPQDFEEVRGQEHAKRALEIAAAGGHNVLMVGPPGAGKTLMARCIPSIMPQMTIEEALDVTKIYSVADQLPPDMPLIQRRPFRSPHHTISHAGLVGGGNWPRPGEISLAHRGVLFLDELPEFGMRVLEVLRQPLEDRIVTISRARGSLTFPANFMLIGAMNPCPCGYYGDPIKECTCTSATITRYHKRISGPLLDRIDLFLEVPRVEYGKLTGTALGEGSKDIRLRVERARAIQHTRFVNAGLNSNSDMGPAEVRTFCPIDAEAQALIREAMNRLQLSARAFHKTLKISRTIADLESEEKIQTQHLAEALQYRSRKVI